MAKFDSTLSFLILTSSVALVWTYCPSVNDGDKQIAVILQSKSSGCNLEDEREEQMIAAQLELIFNQTSLSCTNLTLTVVGGCSQTTVNQLCITQPKFQLTGEQICTIDETGDAPDIVGYLIEDNADVFKSAITSEQFFLTTAPALPESPALSLNPDPKIIIKKTINFIENLGWDAITLFITEEYEQAFGSDELLDELKEAQICLYNRNSYVITQTSTRPSFTSAEKGVVFLGDQKTGERVYKDWSQTEQTWVLSTDPALIAGFRDQPAVAVSIARRDTAQTAVRGQLLTDSLIEILEGLDSNCRFSQPELSTQSIDFYLVSNNEVESLTQDTEEGGVRMPDLEPSLCMVASCMEDCFNQLRDNFEDRYIFIPGKYVFLITMPIHDGTNTSSPWNCNVTEFEPTQSNSRRSILAEIALEDINAKFRPTNANAEPNTFGMVIVDSCFSGIRTNGIISEILRGKKVIKSANGSEELNPRDIVLILSDYSSNVATQVYDYADAVHILQIGTGAASPLLDNRTIYPSFVRVNPSDALVVQTVTKAFTQIRYSGENHIDQVSILYSDNVYGKNSKYLKKLLESNGVNVTSYQRLSKMKEENAAIWLNMKNRDDRFIFIYGDTNDWVPLLDMLKDPESADLRKWWLKEARAFFFDTSVGNNQDLIDKYSDLIRGSLSTFSSPRFSRDHKLFTNYYSELQNPPTSREANPWLSRMWAINFKCKIAGTFECGVKEDRFGDCTPCRQDTGTYTGLVQEDESYGLYLMKAMYTAAEGLYSYARYQDNCSIKDQLERCSILYQRNSKYISQLKEHFLQTEIQINSQEAYQKVFDNATQNGLAFIEIISVKCIVRFCDGVDFIPILNNSHGELIGEPEFYMDTGNGYKVAPIMARNPVSTRTVEEKAPVTSTSWIFILVGIFAFITVALVITLVLVCKGKIGRSGTDLNHAAANRYDEIRLKPVVETVYQASCTSLTIPSGDDAENSNDLIAPYLSQEQKDRLQRHLHQPDRAERDDDIDPNYEVPRPATTNNSGQSSGTRSEDRDCSDQCSPTAVECEPDEPDDLKFNNPAYV